MNPLKVKLLGFSSITVPALFIYASGPRCPETPKHNLQTTLLMPAINFERQKNWELISLFANEDDHVKDFVVTWHNLLEEPPTIPGAKILYRDKPLGQRFNATINTEFVTIIDDDELLSPEYHSRLLWEASKTQGLAGYDTRSYDSNGNYKYYCGYLKNNDCTMTLTKTLVVRKYLLDSFISDKTAMEYIKVQKNCEDILLNFHVRKITGAYPVFVPPCDKSRTNLEETGKLSARWTSWTTKRSDCVRWAQKHYEIL